MRLPNKPVLVWGVRELRRLRRAVELQVAMSIQNAYATQGITRDHMCEIVDRLTQEMIDDVMSRCDEEDEVKRL